MKKTIMKMIQTMFCVMLFATLFTAGPALAEENAGEISYDLGTEGILDLAMYDDSYKEESEHPGTVVTVNYENGIGNKFINVYLPYGYEDNTDTYNVLYIVHGAGGDPMNYLKPEKATAVQKVIDHMIEDGVCDPFIMVAVSWKTSEGEEGESNGESAPDAVMDTVRFAQDELPNYIVPLVDENFRTNADREHRAFSGFSKGGVTTWDVLMNDLKDFETVIPLSGDCWAVEPTGGGSKPEETAEAIAQAITAQGMTGDDFRLFAATGSVDIALANMAPQIIAMQDNDMFHFGENTFFGVMDGISHGDPNARYYLYNIMPMVW